MMVLGTRIAYGAGLRRTLARRTRRPQRIGALLLATLVIAPAATRAQTDYWNGNNDDWNVGADWSLGVPTSLFDVENDTSGTITYPSGTNTVNSFLNTGSGGFTLMNGSLTTSGFFQNTGNGTININGGTLNVGGNFLNTNSGAVNIGASSTLNVTGNFINSGTGTLNFSLGGGGNISTVGGNFSSAGATNIWGGTLSGSGTATSSFEVDNTFLLTDATLTNFSIKNSSAINLLFGTLTNVTLDGGLSVNNGSTTYIGDGVTFGSATPTTVSNYSALYFNGTNNPTFNTELVFGTNGIVIFDGLTLTLGNSALVHGGNGTLGDNSNDTLINQGTIDADVSGSSLTIHSTNFTNNGTLKAENGGNLTINATNWTNAGTLTTSSGGTIYLGGALNNTGITFDALNTVGGTHSVILTGTLTGGSLLNSSSLNIQNGTLANIALDGGLTLANGYDATIGNGVTFGTATPTTLGNNSTLFFNGTSNPTFNTEFILGTNSAVSFNGLTLTLGSNAFVHGSGTLGSGKNDTLINQGTIEANVQGGTLNILANAFTNSGTLKAENGDNVTIDATNWTNTGTLSTSGGSTIYLGGTFNNTGATFDALNTIGGTHNAILTGTLTGGNLLNSSSLNIQNGTLTNIALDGGLTLANGYAATIGNDVTFGTATPTTVSNNSTLTFTGTTWTLPGSLTTSSGGTIYLGGTLNNAGATFDAINTIGGTHNAILTGALTGGNLLNSSALNIQNGTLTNIALDGGLTLANGYTATIGNGVTFGTATPTTLNTDSTLSFNGANNPTFNTELVFGDGNNSSYVRFDGLTLTLGSSALVHGTAGTLGTLGSGNNDTLINQGTIDAADNTITISSANFTNTGTLEAENGGRIYIEPALWTIGGTLSTAGGGTIFLGGTIDNTGTTFDPLSIAGGTDNAVLIGTLTGGNLVNSSMLNIQGGTLTNITLDGGLALANNDYATIGDGVTFGTATPTTLTNYSTIIFHGANSPTFNTELIFGTGYNQMVFDGMTLTLGTSALIHGTFGFIGNGINDTLINQGTIDANGSGSTLAIDSFNFTNAGTLKAENGGSLTIGGNFSIQPTYWAIGGTLSTASGGTIYLDGIINNVGTTFDALTVVGGTHNGILTGILTGGTLVNSSALNIQNGTLTNITLDGGLSVTHTDDVFIGNDVTFGSATPTIIDNSSTLRFKDTTNPTFNAELIFGTNGGTLSFLGLYSPLTLTLSSDALVHGANGNIGDGDYGTLINQGTIDADVSGGVLTINSASITNTGLLEAHNGSLVVNSDLVLAGGALYVTPGNTVSANVTVTQTGGTTRVDGALTTATDLQLKGGDLIGTGTINGNVNNTGGTVRPGDLLGTLTINGNYTQIVGGTTEIDLGGTQQGVTSHLLNVTGLASLGGALDVKLTGGFVPTVGETFDFLNYGSLSGAYDSLVALDNGYGYTVSYGNGVGILTVATVAAVPETSTLLMAGLMLCAGGLLLRRRERRQ